MDFFFFLHPLFFVYFYDGSKRNTQLRIRTLSLLVVDG